MSDIWVCQSCRVSAPSAGHCPRCRAPLVAWQPPDNPSAEDEDLIETVRSSPAAVPTAPKTPGAPAGDDRAAKALAAMEAAKAKAKAGAGDAAAPLNNQATLQFRAVLPIPPRPPEEQEGALTAAMKANKVKPKRGKTRSTAAAAGGLSTQQKAVVAFLIAAIVLLAAFIGVLLSTR